MLRSATHADDVASDHDPRRIAEQDSRCSKDWDAPRSVRGRRRRRRPASAAGPPARPTPAAGAGAPPAAPPPAPPRRRPVAAEPRPPGSPTRPQEQFETLKRHIHIALVDRLDMNRVSEMDPKTLRSEIRGVVEHLCDTENPLLNRNERQRLVNEILDETFGFGPLELLLKDDKISDIMINGPKKIYVEKAGRIEQVGRRLPRQRPPAADHRPHRLAGRPARGRDLADGRRPPARRLAFNAIIPPLALDGAVGHDPDVRLQAADARTTCSDYKAFTPEMLDAHGRRASRPG